MNTVAGARKRRKKKKKKKRKKKTREKRKMKRKKRRKNAEIHEKTVQRSAVSVLKVEGIKYIIFGFMISILNMSLQRSLVHPC